MSRGLEMPRDKIARLEMSIAIVEKAIRVKREPALTRALAKLDQELAKALEVRRVRMAELIRTLKGEKA